MIQKCILDSGDKLLKENHCDGGHVFIRIFVKEICLPSVSEISEIPIDLKVSSSVDVIWIGVCDL